MGRAKNRKRAEGQQQGQPPPQQQPPQPPPPPPPPQPQPPPPPPQQPQPPPPPQPQPPPPQQQQQLLQSQPVGASAVKNKPRKPAKNRGGGGGEPRPINRTWGDGDHDAGFDEDIASLLLLDKKTARAGRDANVIACNKYHSSPLANHIAGRVQAEGGHPIRALKHLHRASELQPGCLGISFSLATLHAEMKEFGLAADECRRALAVSNPCDPALHAVSPPPEPWDTSVPAQLLRVAIAKDQLRGLRAKVSTLPRNVEAVRQFWSGMTELERKNFLKVRMSDMFAYLGRAEPHIMDSLQAALQFYKDTRRWQYWICPQCKNVYPTSDMFSSHVEEKHSRGIQECLLNVPKRIAGEQAEIIQSWNLVQESGSTDVQKIMACDIMRKIVHLNNIGALSEDLVAKLTQQCNNHGAPDQTLSTIASFDVQDLQNMASCLQLIQQSPMVLAHEKSHSGEHNDSHLADHIIVEEETLILSIGDENTEPNNAFNADFIFNLICKSVRQRSLVLMRQECIADGAEVLQDMEGLICSLQELVKQKQSLTDKNADSMDVDILRVTAGLDYVKNKLAKVCAFDYREIIMPPLRAYLNDKLHGLSKQEGHEVPTEVSDDNSKTDKKQPPPTRTSYAAAMLKRDDDKLVGENFLKFLKEYKCAPAESPFYEGELKAMVHRRSETFCVYYKHTKGQYDSLGNSMCRHYSRIAPFLNDALLKFITEQNMMTECKQVLLQRPRVHICDLPERSIQSLLGFLRDRAIVLIKKVQIYGNPNDTVIATTKLGRDLFLGFLLFVIEKHRTGKSWNGDLSIEDLEVVNRSTFEIAKEASARATRESMANDLKKLLELLKRHFQTTEGRQTAYFANLFSDIHDCLDHLDTYNSDITTEFQNHLLSHLALKSEMARGHLFLDLYRVHQGLGKDDYRNLRKVLSFSSTVSNSWVTKVEQHPVLKQVFSHGFDADTRTDKTSENTTEKASVSTSKHEAQSVKKNKGYGDHLEHLLLFIRHVIQHGPDHTKDHGEQKMKSLIETDLFIAKYLHNDVSNLIKTLLDHYTMKEEMFADAWTHYSDSR